MMTSHRPAPRFLAFGAAAGFAADNDVIRLGDDLLHAFTNDVVIVRNEHLDHVRAVRAGMRTETIYRGRPLLRC